jgi:hypothetical protein
MMALVQLHRRIHHVAAVGGGDGDAPEAVPFLAGGGTKAE